MFYDLINGSTMIQLYMELAADQAVLNPKLRLACRSAEWHERLARAREGMGCQVQKSSLSDPKHLVGYRLARLANDRSSPIQTLVRGE
jgi:hypothetical protein